MWFTGTSTGSAYTVGRAYSMGGDVYVAQHDGTFENQRTGRETVGSSEDPRVQWGGYLPSLTGYSSGGSGAGNASVATGAAPGPGNGIVVAGEPSGGGPGNGYVVSGGSDEWVEVKGGVQLDPIPSGGPLRVREYAPTTPLMMGGLRMETHRAWSDGQQFEDRWGEWGGSLAGLGVLGADVVQTLGADPAVRAVVDKDREFSEWLAQTFMGVPLGEVKPIWPPDWWPK